MISCDVPLCISDPENEPDSCDEDDWDWDEEDSFFSKRSYTDTKGNVMWSYTYYEEKSLAKRGPPGLSRPYTLKLGKLLGSLFEGKIINMKSRPYPDGLKVLKGVGSSTLALKGGFV